VPALIGTDYGRLLLAKVALFLAMVGVAAINRLWLTPRLALTVTSPRCEAALLHEQAANEAPAAARTALRALARNSVMEAMLGLAILVIVGALGTTPPGLHVLQPTWPFAVRYGDAAFGDAELHATIALAMWAIGGGLLCGALLTLIGAKVRRTHPPLTPWLIAVGTSRPIRRAFTLRRQGIRQAQSSEARNCSRPTASPAMGERGAATARPAGSCA